jgi:hypothetical protein
MTKQIKKLWSCILLLQNASKSFFFFEDDWNFKSFHKKAAHGYIIPVPHFFTENGNWIFILPLAR